MSGWDDDLRETAQDAEPDAETPSDVEATARQLAKLPLQTYEQRRLSEAKRLSVRVRFLDDAVERYRKDGTSENEDADPFPEIRPWSDSVDGAELLDKMVLVFRRYLVLPDHSAEAMALWCLHAHAHDVAEISPILAIVSPEKRCGKTTTIKVVSALVPRPMHSVNMSPSVLFRVIEKHKPTVLVDEGDTFLKDHDDLRGILNGGHDRTSARVWRSVGDDHEPRSFKVWSPKAIAMIGRLPDTLEDRSIVVPLRRRLDGEKVDRFRSGRLDQFTPLAAKAARWAADNLDALREQDPALPEDLNDRAQDNWRALVAIADRVGGHWPATARVAASALSSEAAKGNDSVSPGVLLLRDISEIMGDQETMSSTALVSALNELEEAPWSEWRRGLPITTSGVARLLKSFGIKPYRGKGASVYRAADLQDAWSRYLDRSPHEPPDEECEPATRDRSATKDVNDFNDPSQVAGGRSCDGVADGKCDDDMQEVGDWPDAATVRGVI